MRFIRPAPKTVEQLAERERQEGAHDGSQPADELPGLVTVLAPFLGLMLWAGLIALLL